MTYTPDAAEPADRATLSEEEAFEDVHPGATAETFAAQTNKDRGHYPGAPSDDERKEAGDKVEGSALPREQGKRG